MENENSYEDTDTLPTQVQRQVTPDVTTQPATSDFVWTDAEKRQIEMLAQSQLRAQEILSQREYEAIPQEELAEVEVYDQRYFPTKILSEIFLPLCILVLGIIALGLSIDIAQRSPGSDTAIIAFIGITLIVIAAAWGFVASYKAAFSSIAAADGAIEFRSPRNLWLVLLGKKSRYNTSEVAINDYWPSFLNFIPGWNSWTLEMDTPAKGDELKLQQVKHVRDGQLLVAIITPGLRPKKRDPISLMKGNKRRR